MPVDHDASPSDAGQASSFLPSAKTLASRARLFSVSPALFTPAALLDVDLFSGPGRYADGQKSTQVLVVEKAISHAELRNMLVTIFNDGNAAFAQSLENEINELPGVSLLKHRPAVHDFEIDEEITRLFEQTKMVPTLSFIDPWGYKGLSLRLITALLKDWGSDCIFEGESVWQRLGVEL